MKNRWWTPEQELYVSAERPTETAHPHPRLLAEAMPRWLADAGRQLAALGNDWPSPSQWRQQARRFVVEQMAWPVDPPCELRAETIDRREHDQFVQEQIVFTTTPPMRVPATLLLPRRGSGPFPGIVALHDMGGFRLFGREKLLAFDGEPQCLTEHRQRCYSGASVMADLARRGYAVICIDAMNFGLRTEAATENREAFERWRLGATHQEARAFAVRISYGEEHFHVQQLMSIGRSWPGLIFSDDRRTIDYLLTRPEIDPSRIGCLGLSFGAYRATYLAALDERVRAAVSVCWASTLDGVIGHNRYALNWFASVPGVFAKMDLPDVLALAAPRALMVISGWRDGLMRPAGAARCHLHLRECFQSFGCPQQLGSLIYDADHEFNATMQRDAFRWLDEKLRGDS